MKELREIMWDGVCIGVGTAVAFFSFLSVAVTLIGIISVVANAIGGAK